MKRHLNTLFVMTEGAYLRKDGMAVVVRVERETKLRVPLHNLDGIVCFGRIGCSPMLMGACAEHDITISFLSPWGGFRAAVVGFSPGNVLLRRAQYRIADDEQASCEFARNAIAAKVANSWSVLLRGARDTSDEQQKERLRTVARRLAHFVADIEVTTSLERLRGLEGESASSYFDCFNDLIRANREAFQFHGRTRRPPKDNVNALMSFLYSMLTHDLRSACEAVCPFYPRRFECLPGFHLEVTDVCFGNVRRKHARPGREASASQSCQVLPQLWSTCPKVGI